MDRISSRKFKFVLVMYGILGLLSLYVGLIIDKPLSVPGIAFIGAGVVFLGIFFFYLVRSNRKNKTNVPKEEKMRDLRER